MSKLFIIPARKGSKGIPGKNVKIFNGKPLIEYSIEFALKIKDEDDRVLVSTDDEKVIQIARKLGVDVPFIRPSILSNDDTSAVDVLLHAIETLKKNGHDFELIVLLQPTSPIRSIESYYKMLELYKSTNSEMTVSVVRQKNNPFYNMYYAEKGLLRSLTSSYDRSISRRQDVPAIFSYNGSIYIIRTLSLLERKSMDFTRVSYLEMPLSLSVDIDEPEEWEIAEFIQRQQ